MTKLTAVGCALLVTSAALHPSSSQASMAAGLKSGVNLETLGGSDAPSDKSLKVGFEGGAFLTLGVAKNFAIQPEAQFAMRGVKVKFMSDGQTIDGKLKMNYIVIPVLGKFVIPVSSSTVKPSLFAGPSVGFRLTAKATGQSGTTSGDVDVKDQTKAADFGIVFGGGLDHAMSSGSIGLDVRYNLGLTTIDKKDATSGKTPDEKNRVFTIMAVYSRPFGQ